MTQLPACHGISPKIAILMRKILEHYDEWLENRSRWMKMAQGLWLCKCRCLMFSSLDQDQEWPRSGPFGAKQNLICKSK